MTENELEELLIDCPRLFHMAERGAFHGICRHGLLSTTALLDLFDVKGETRNRIERRHRPHIERISHPKLGTAAIRDQIPMSDEGLIRALPTNISPEDWYLRLNRMTFFWLSEDRLLRLTGARAYRDVEHEILVLDTRSLVKDFYSKIWLCPINSGCTKPMPHPRNFDIFKRITDYPYAHYKSRRPRRDRVVELCVDYSVENIQNYLMEAFVMKGGEKILSL